MTKRSNPRAEHLRRALAQEAARIMAEQGIDDYRLAKRKAAERLGATDIAVLPKNTEIEEALADHQRLFESHTHSSTLRDLRVATFCWVAGCNHIFPFIAGAMRTRA